MLPNRIETPGNDQVCQAVIGQGVHLTGTYDPDQHWFPFMSGAVINTWKEDQREKPAYVPRTFNNPKFARMSRDGRVIFLYEKDVPQWPLPFAEFKALSKQDFKRLEKGRFPAWDLYEGQPIVIPVKKEMNKEVRAWCMENCKGRFHLRPHSLFLEKQEDMVMASVFWKTQEKVPYLGFK